LAELERAPLAGGNEDPRHPDLPLTLVRGKAPAGEPRWITDLRLRALDRFDRLPWPTPQEEEWRRTDLTEVDFRRFRAQGQDTAGLSALEPGTPTAGLSGTARFAGGTCRELSLSPELARRGVRFATLAALASEGDGEGPAGEAFRRCLEDGLRELDNRFQAWHYASLSHGIFLYVPPFVEVGETFVVELLEAEDGVVSVPHVSVVLDRGARAKVFLRTCGSPRTSGSPGDTGAPEGRQVWRSLVNLGMDLVVGEEAALDFHHLQDLPTDVMSIFHATSRVARDGHLLAFEAALGSGLLKSRLECSLEGPGSEAFLNGVYLSRERQHMDIRTVQRHRAPSTTSRAFYKGALKDRSRAIYQGLIEVTPQAAKTDAYLTDRNLILNDGARADSIPSLRIDTNDVRCSHGSTTGKIDEAQVFYLMSRGLPRAEAERMLTLGYFEELLAPAPEHFADELRELVGERIAGGAAGGTDARG